MSINYSLNVPLRIFKLEDGWTFQFTLLHLLLGSLFVISYYFFTQGPSEAPVKFEVSVPEEATPGWTGVVLQEPKIKEAGLSAIQCYCPATGQKLSSVNPATADGIDRAIGAAAEAQVAWAKTTWSQRRKVLKTMLKFILDNQDDIARVAARDSGKPMLDASFGEILVTAEKLQWVIKHGEKALTTERRPTSFLMMYKKNEVRWEPLGVVAACVSWNYPMHNFFGPLIAALFTGNAIVIKPSERTAWSSTYFLRIAREALSSCNHSPALVQSLLLWPQTASHLTSHPSISHITFIGSRPVSKHVLASAATAIIPVCVELGGKDPCIILDDAPDLPSTAAIILRGTFQSSGQNCIGIERVVALPAVYDSLISLLEPKIRALRLGSGIDDDEDVDVGAMVTSDNFSHLESLIEDAVADGARLLAGGRRYAHPKHPSGHYFTPTLLADVTPAMQIAQEEVFAPICLLMRASTVAGAIAVANSTSYALGASVFGTNKADIEAVVHGVKAGMVSVNDFAVYYAVQLPFGGRGGSGYGRFAGEEGLRSLCNTKAVCRDRFGGTSIPSKQRYPVEGRAAWELARAVVWLGYGGLGEKMKGLWDIVRNL